MTDTTPEGTTSTCRACRRGIVWRDGCWNATDGSGYACDAISSGRDEHVPTSMGLADAMGRIVHGSRWDDMQGEIAEERARQARRYEAETKRLERGNAWHAVLVLAALLALVLVFVAGLVVIL